MLNITMKRTTHNSSMPLKADLWQKWRGSRVDKWPNLGYSHRQVQLSCPEDAAYAQDSSGGLSVEWPRYRPETQHTKELQMQPHMDYASSLYMVLMNAPRRCVSCVDAPLPPFPEFWPLWDGILKVYLRSAFTLLSTKAQALCCSFSCLICTLSSSKMSL